jgi:hypothetical protein
MDELKSTFFLGWGDCSCTDTQEIIYYIYFVQRANARFSLNIQKWLPEGARGKFSFAEIQTPLRHLYNFLN